MAIHFHKYGYSKDNISHSAKEAMENNRDDTLTENADKRQKDLYFIFSRLTPSFYIYTVNLYKGLSR